MNDDSSRTNRFADSLFLLHKALECGPAALSPLEKEGAIRRFEYCLDAAWKAAREFLEGEGLLIAPITPRETLRQAAAAKIVADAEVWIDMFNHRNLLAHNYDGVIIAEVTAAIAARYLPAMEQLNKAIAAPVELSQEEAQSGEETPLASRLQINCAMPARAMQPEK